MIYNSPSSYINTDGSLNIDAVTKYITDAIDSDPTRQQIRLPIDSTSMAVLRKALGVVNNTTPQGGVILSTNALVNGIVSGYVKSDNYVAGTTGWSIKGDGTAEFSNAIIRGYINAATGVIGGWGITATTIQDASGLVGMSSAITGGDDVRFWAGNIVPSSAPFYVTESGILNATNANISGTITATLGSIGGWTIGATSIYKSAIVLDSANDQITVNGTSVILNSSGITAIAGTVGGFTLGLSTLVAGAGSTRISLDTSNGIHLGNTNFNSAPFRVALDGTLTATVANISGSITATSGSIGGFTIASGYLYGGIIKTALTVGAGSTGVVMDTNGLRGYDAILGNTFNLPTDGSAPTFSSAIINNTVFNINTNAILRTSTTVGDGTANSAGILINNTGLYACASNQTLANANVKILVDGTAVFTANVKGGQTDYATGTGYFLGLSGGNYKFSIGNTTNYMRWDGTYLILKGSFDVGTSGIINNSVYTVVNLPVAPTIIGFNVPSAYE